MADPIEQFNLDLEQLLNHAPVSMADPALKTASVLLLLETETKVSPPAGLRARWIAGTQAITRAKRNSPIQWLHSRTLIAVLTALICLVLISGGAYALARSLGYIPELGLVTKGTQVRLLASPISRTRDSVTITVKDAIWNAENMLVVFEVQGLSPETYSPLEPLNTCTVATELHFSNAKPVEPSEGETEPLTSEYESRYKFESIPPDATGVTLFIPCIEGALAPGILPENWEVPLHFIAAPPDMIQTIVPVIEPTDAAIPQAADPLGTANAQPTIQPQATHTNRLPAGETQPGAGTQNPISISQVIDTGDTYILVGSCHPPAPTQAGEWRSDLRWITLTDDNGQAVNYQPPADIHLPAADTLQEHTWAIEFSKEFVSPLHIHCLMRYALKSAAQDAVRLDFDAGPDPQPGQEWDLNREFQYAGHMVRLAKISTNIGKAGYIFWFETEDPSINALSVRFDGYSSSEHLFQLSGTDMHGVYRWVFYEYYDRTLPKGNLEIVPFDLYLNGETKSWVLDWQP